MTALDYNHTNRQHRSLFWTSFISALVFWLAPNCQAQRGPAIDKSTSPIRFEQIEEVIVNWRDDRHVYVSGNIGVGAPQLADLQQWLAEHGPHWTVVLMETAAGQTFEAADGRRYSGMDAVEYALGFGLNNRTDFGKLEHPETHETDAAVFVLFLKERKFSYYASDAQDRRNLGHSRWIGGLDQPAFRAMRSGGRIIDAVKNTVTSINTQLDLSISNEQRLAEQQRQAREASQRLEAEERQRARAEVETQLGTLRMQIAEVQRENDTFVAAHEAAQGPLSHPPIATWNQTLTSLEQQLTAENARSIEQKLSEVALEISRFLNAYAGSAAFQQHSDQLQARIAALGDGSSLDLNQKVNQVRQTIEAAHNSLKAGELNFPEILNQADGAIQAAETTAAELRQQEDLRQLRNLWIRRTLIATGAVLATILAGILIWLNRRRRPSMLKALQALAEREASILRETQQLDRLFMRNEDILGSREKIQSRGYEGKTRELALNAFDYVDDLFIISKEIKRVLNEARNYVTPADPWNHLLNLFSTTHYQQAIEHLSGKPLKFSRISGIPLIFRNAQFSTTSQNDPESSAPKSASSSASSVVDPIEPAEEISLTFEQILAALLQRGEQAQDALGTIEGCLTTVQEQLNQAQQELQQLFEQDQALAQAAERDGWFQVVSNFEQLIPAIQANIKTADDLSAFDAVQAVQGPLAQAQQQITEARQLSQNLDDARTQLLPYLQACEQALASRGSTAAWITTELRKLSERANSLFAQAVSSSIADGSAQLATDIKSLKDRATQLVDLARDIHETHSPDVDRLAERIKTARNTLAQQLSVPADQVLQELDSNPDACLARASNSLRAAEAMLQQGRVEAVISTIETLRTEIDQADGLIVASHKAVKAFAEERQQLRQLIENQLNLVPPLSQRIQQIRSAYALEALLIDGESEELTADNNAVGQQKKQHLEAVLQQATTQLGSAQQHLASAEQAYNRAQVLSAAETLEQARRTLAKGTQQLRQIADTIDRLQNQSSENRVTQEHNEQAVRMLEDAHNNPLVMSHTLAAIAQARDLVAQNRLTVDVAQTAPNPFETARTLAATRQKLEQLQAQIIGDQQAHAEARRAVAGAAQQLNLAGNLVRQSQADGIPDSSQIIQTNNRVAGLARELQQVEAELDQSHGDWTIVDERAARLHTLLSESTQTLSQELRVADEALKTFQQASQAVIEAESWSGPWGIRISGSPGVQDLENARRGIQSGHYQSVLDASRRAMLAAQTAIQVARREAERREMQKRMAAEQARRQREIASQSSWGSSGSFGSSSDSSWSSSSSSSSSSSTSSSSSSGGDSGFSRSGW